MEKKIKIIVINQNPLSNKEEKIMVLKRKLLIGGIPISAKKPKVNGNKSQILESLRQRKSRIFWKEEFIFKER